MKFPRREPDVYDLSPNFVKLFLGQLPGVNPPPRPLPAHVTEAFIIGVSRVTEHAHAVNRANGFWEARDRLKAAFPQDRAVAAITLISQLGLVDSEIAEAMEAVRKQDPKTWADTGKDTLVSELAGAVVRIMDIAASLNLPLARGVLAELGRNAGRGHLHGGKAA